MTIHLTWKIFQFLAGRLQASRTVKRERWSPAGFDSAQEGSDDMGFTGIEVALGRGGGGTRGLPSAIPKFKDRHRYRLIGDR